MKSYTDIEQSKKLAEILPFKSVDMWYWEWPTAPEYNNYEHPMFHQGEDIRNIPCWSLAALFDIIPQEIFDGEYVINITEGHDNKWLLTYDHYENRDHSYFGLSSSADNLVDACVKIITRLHELKLL